MKTMTFSVCLLGIIILTSYGPAGEVAAKDTPRRSGCYIYVSVNKEKKIVIYRLDPSEEDLISVGKQDMAGEPGSLCTDGSARKMYAGLRDISSVASMNINVKSGKLDCIKNTPVADNPVYISTDKRGKYLFFTSYNGNKNAVYPIRREGVDCTPVQVIDARINPHMIKADAAGKHVFVPNKGGDVVQQFIFRKSGILEPNNPDAVAVSAGSGPRHFTINPGGNIMFVVNELSCTVIAFNYDKKTGTLSGPFQEISTKPADYTQYNTCADIHITPDGKFLYASNRGHDSLAGFSIDSISGNVTAIGWFPTEKEPREFEIDPSGKYLIAAGESSGRIALYRIENNGFLTLLKTYTVGKWPVWVKAVQF